MCSFNASRPAEDRSNPRHSGRPLTLRHSGRPLTLRHSGRPLKSSTQRETAQTSAQRKTAHTSAQRETAHTSAQRETAQTSTQRKTAPSKHTQRKTAPSMHSGRPLTAFVFVACALQPAIGSALGFCDVFSHQIFCQIHVVQVLELCQPPSWVVGHECS